VCLIKKKKKKLKKKKKDIKKSLGFLGLASHPKYNWLSKKAQMHIGLRGEATPFPSPLRLPSASSSTSDAFFREPRHSQVLLPAFSPDNPFCHLIYFDLINKQCLTKIYPRDGDVERDNL
jgi:hypothetical protein